MAVYWLVPISYIIGSFPSAYIAARLSKNVDIRNIGDRNPGASNVFRNVGHMAGMIVLALDIGKGALVILLARAFASEQIVLLCGIAVVAGHNWSIFLKFKGGRGLATIIGVLFVLLTIPMAIVSIAGIISLWTKRSLITTGLIMFIPLLVLAWLFGKPIELILYSIVLLCSAGIMHLVTNRRLTREQRGESIRWQ
jgi:glycerol-3-phosphate acyltransferase PlsY